MLQGKNLSELAHEIQRQTTAKRDFVAAAEAISLWEDGKTLSLNGMEYFVTSDLAHDQIGQFLNIPLRYYHRLQQSHPALLASNVNTLLHASEAKRMVRTLDGTARAFLSDRYRRLDHHALVEATFPVIAEQECQVVSCEITARKLYVQVVNPRQQADVKPGDVVQAGLLLTNSEVGHGALQLQPLIYRLVCTNGLILAEKQDYTLTRYHVGRAQDAGVLEQFYRDETVAAADRAFWMQVQDTMRAAIKGEFFTGVVNQLRDATMQPITGQPGKVVELAAQSFGLTDTEQGSVLQHLLSDGDLSRYGLLNAITRTGEAAKSYDRAVELQTLGSEVLRLPSSAWQRLAAAA
ncbi:MAG: DUF932 domain-containing protein [Blastocatellia bacterium]